MEWYALHTYAGHEEKVKQEIETRAESLGLQERISRVLVPVEEVVKYRQGKRRTVKKKVFPGYVLVEMAPDEVVWSFIRGTVGVTGVLSNSAQPMPLLNSLLTNILPESGTGAADSPGQTESRFIREGVRSQSDIRVESYPDRQRIVKDYSRLRGWRRWFSRWIIARECRAYQFLSDCPGTAQCLGRPTPLSLELSYVEGRLCDEFAVGELPDAFFDRLREVVDAIHARGVAHNDLKRKRNIIVTGDFRPIVIDLAAAWWSCPRWNPLRRWIFRQLCEVDLNAICKLKKRLAPHLLSEEDRHRLEHPTLLERLARRALNR